MRLPADTLVLGKEGTFSRWGFEDRLPKCLESIGRIVEPLGIRPQVWAHENVLERLALVNPGAGDSPRFVPFFQHRGPYQYPTKYREDLWSCSYWYIPKGQGFDLHVPGWDRRSPFAGTPDTRSLLELVCRYHEVMGGAQWRGTGAQTSDALIGRHIPPTRNPPELLRGQVRESPFVWHRKLGEHERRLRYCYALDQNGAYLAVPGSLELPIGKPERVDWPEFDKRVPGIWLVDLPDWSAQDTPPPWGEDDGSLDRWVTTPTMERINQSLGLEPLGGWVWRSHERAMRKWQERLRDARARLVDDDEWSSPVGRAVRQVYQEGPGRLMSAQRGRRDDPEKDPLYRPYWALAIIAESRARLHRHLTSRRVSPIAIYRDCLYFLSSRASPERLAENLGLPVGAGLGEFKSAGMCRAGPVRELLEHPLPTASGTVTRLHDLVESGR